mmetsp:Transcript_34698/g.91642  ORF Transcript_34698/g.91642 Transcript_34698/m.91642 type:complete len:323 (+) Transcript_34698:2038-3006(+)
MAKELLAKRSPIEHLAEVTEAQLRNLYLGLQKRGHVGDEQLQHPCLLQELAPHQYAHVAELQVEDAEYAVVVRVQEEASAPQSSENDSSGQGDLLPHEVRHERRQHPRDPRDPRDARQPREAGGSREARGARGLLVDGVPLHEPRVGEDTEQRQQVQQEHDREEVLPQPERVQDDLKEVEQEDGGVEHEEGELHVRVAPQPEQVRPEERVDREQHEEADEHRVFDDPPRRETDRREPRALIEPLSGPLPAALLVHAGQAMLGKDAPQHATKGLVLLLEPDRYRLLRPLQEQSVQEAAVRRGDVAALLTVPLLRPIFPDIDRV